jgi:hypothetical protein
VRAEETLVLETLEGGVHRPDGQLAPGALGEVGAYGETVRVIGESNDGEEGGELEGAETRSGH